jgi:6-phosphogluconolactonase (cycloisomerase 2 family)
MTNALGNNQVLVFHRGADGNLTPTPVQTISTGGGGSGLQLAGVDALGSSGSIQLDAAHHILFVVNTESAAENNGAGAYNTDCAQGTITSFLVGADGTLTFADRVFSRGLFPNSLAVKTILVPAQPDEDNKGKGKHKGDKDDTPQPLTVVYVLNAGGPQAPAICNNQPASANTPNITGFQVDDQGRMRPIASSTQSIDPGPASAATGVSCLAATAAGFSGLTGAPAADFSCGLNPPSFARSPAQVGFSPDGSQLVVTVKGTNTIYVFPVDQNGVATSPKITQAPGPELPTFFGFAFDRNADLLASELFGSATTIPKGGAGALSSFVVGVDGSLGAISSHVNDNGTAATSIALEPITGRFAYVTNNLSASISSYSVSNNGTVTLLSGTANGSALTAGPNDIAIAQDGTNSFLYVVNAGTGTVGAFQINLADGSLTPLTGGMGLPAGRSAQGLAAY